MDLIHPWSRSFSTGTRLNPPPSPVYPPNNPPNHRSWPTQARTPQYRRNMVPQPNQTRTRPSSIWPPKCRHGRYVCWMIYDDCQWWYAYTSLSLGDRNLCKLMLWAQWDVILTPERYGHIYMVCKILRIKGNTLHVCVRVSVKSYCSLAMGTFYN